MAQAVPFFEERHVTANGVDLHVIDHGGRGPPIVFLAGLNSTAHIFDDLAPRFADRHRVIAITRRGHGASAKPADGYDTDTLVADIVGTLDALGIARATLIGHSMAGGEMSRLAERYPDRVERLVYLDAAYDRERLPELMDADPAGEPQPAPSDLASFETFEAWYRRTLGFWSPAAGADLRAMYRGSDGSLRPSMPAAAGKALYDGMIAFRPNYRAIEAPALAIYAIETSPTLPPDAGPATRAAAERYLQDTYVPWQRAQAARFRNETGCARTEVWTGAHHFLFLEQPDRTERVIRAFLGRRRPCAPPRVSR